MRESVVAAAVHRRAGNPEAASGAKRGMIVSADFPYWKYPLNDPDSFIADMDINRQVQIGKRSA
jgi:hypothetical protein